MCTPRINGRYSVGAAGGAATRKIVARYFWRVRTRRHSSLLRFGLLACFILLACLPLVPSTHAQTQATLVATINGGGKALMQPPGLGNGISFFGTGVKLFSDGSATGHFDCVDQSQDVTGGGNIFGNVVSWFVDGNEFINLNIVGEFVAPGGHPQSVTFVVTIQQFGGPGVGHWSLAIGPFLFCWELLTSGQIVYSPQA